MFCGTTGGMVAFIIRLARAEDAPQMALLSRDLIEAGLGWRWTPSRVRHKLRDRATNGLVATDGQRVVGFALMQYLEEQAHLLLFAVTVPSRRSGVGRAMLEWLEETALVAGIGRIELEVRACNLGARAFYRVLGFEEGATVPGYYAGVEAAVRMRRDLWTPVPRSAASDEPDRAAWSPPP